MAWYDNVSQRTAVREYKSRGEMQRDANKAAERGWTVVSVTEASQRSGCLRMATVGIFALVWRPKPRIMVTYQHQ